MSSTTLSNFWETVNRVVDAWIDQLIRLTDIIVRKHITLSEGLLFFLSCIRMIWFAIFGVQNANYDMIWGAYVWVPVYAAVNTVHFLAFFRSSLKLRCVALCLQAFVWCFLTLISLASVTGRTSVATPSLFVFTLFSLFIATRLYREEHSLNG